ncbi:ankyrin repeat-containing protein [Botrytis cinerea]
MSRNSDDVLCFVCTVSGDRNECTVAIESIVHKFSSGAQKYDYEVQLPVNEAPKSEELQKVHNLCRIKVQGLWRQLDPLPKPDKGKGVVPPPSSDVEKISQPPAAKDRPDTIRIKNIPVTYTREVVEIIVQREFRSKPKIRSLALHTKGYHCATVTFPEEDYGFPTEQLPKVILDRQSRSDVPQIQYDADFLNFTTLYNANSEGCKLMWTVVGLGTHAFGTFRSTTPGSHEMWLRDFLPKDIPNTRILLYGYPSTVSGGQSMEKKHLDTKSAIIFIGQSLGGLIVQESLLIAADSCDPYEREMFGSWHGLVGFGIPIAGLNNPSLIEAVKSQPNKVLIGQLCRDRENGTPSSYLIELKHRFESCCKRKERSSSHAPEVLYFWERHYSQPRTRNGIVGEKVLMVEDSATPGARNLPLNSDHSGMVKYSSRSDLLYEDVSSNIDSMVFSLAEQRNVVQSTSLDKSLQKGDEIINKPSAPRRRGTFLSEDELERMLA